MLPPLVHNLPVPDEARKLLRQLFGDFSLSEIQAEIWKLYKAGAINGSIYSTDRDRSNLIYLCERLCEGLNAAYVIAESQERKIIMAVVDEQ